MKSPFSFHNGEVAAQQRWNTTELWDESRKQRLLMQEIPQEFHQRLSTAPFFFLATSDKQGQCDCSFKGGGPGLVKIINAQQFAFPDFSGNGAFMSLGNILQNPQVGCLFIDFNDGARLRINGIAEIIEGESAQQLFADAERAVVVSVQQVVPNCTAHIPKFVPTHLIEDQ